MKPPIPDAVKHRKHVVQFVYKNHRGETALRTVIPQRMVFKETEWHPEQQWILVGYDVYKAAFRHFAMKDVSKWTPHPL